jgi:ankyrin repeat protein
MFACDKGHGAIVKALLGRPSRTPSPFYPHTCTNLSNQPHSPARTDKGADFEKATPTGITPLQLACHNDYAGCLSVFYLKQCSRF